MAHTHRTVPTRPERRRRRIEGAARLQRLASRDAYREARLQAAPEPLWLLSGDWGDGFALWPLQPARRAGAGESLISDPGDTAHLWEAVTHWQV